MTNAASIRSLSGYPSHLVIVTASNGRVGTVPANNLAEAEAIAARYTARGIEASVRVN